MVFLLPSAILFTLFGAVHVAAQGSRQYTIQNSCPTEINLYIGGQYQQVIPSGSSISRTLGVNAGFFYTDANGGNSDGFATRAGFYGDNNSSYYYIVKDVTAFNTGLSITPNYPPSGGYCQVASCNDRECPSTSAYTAPPTRFPPVDPNAPPPLPNYACPRSDLSFTITFCPGGSFPSAPVIGKELNPNGNPNKCMDVQGGVFANGTPVQIYDCNGTPAQKWILNRGSTKVKLAAANFCLDVGTSPQSGVGMKIWQCYDDLPAQHWSYNTDNRLVVWRLGQCLDLTDGNLDNWNRLQIWQCTPNNQNQVWTMSSQ